TLRPMLDCAPESNILLPGSAAEVERSSAAHAEEAVVLLFDQMRAPLLRYLLGFPLGISDAEDVVQESFLALYKHLHGRKMPHNPRGWIFRAAHHLALKRQIRARKDSQSAGAIDGVETFAIDPSPNPEDRFSLNQTQERIMAVVRALPEQSRWCLYLRAEGLRYREIADIVGVSLGAVSLRLARSLALIGSAARR